MNSKDSLSEEGRGRDWVKLPLGILGVEHMGERDLDPSRWNY